MFKNKWQKQAHDSQQENRGVIPRLVFPIFLQSFLNLSFISHPSKTIFAPFKSGADINME
jgi:hypothetical protein